MKITDIDGLRGFIFQQLERVASGEITPASANASANLAGKVLQSVKMELEYNKLIGLNPNIKFLGLNPEAEQPKKLEAAK